MNTVPETVHTSLPNVKPQTAGFNRRALDFVGADAEDRINAGHPAEINLDGSSFTIEFFLLIHDLNTDHGLFNKIDSAATDKALHSRIYTAGDIRLAFWGDDITCSYSWEFDKWYHVAMRYRTSDNRMSIVINGKEEGSYIAGGDLTATDDDDLIFGYEGFEDWLNGRMTEIRVYTRHLTLPEIRHNMLNYHNPVRGNLGLWYRVEEGTGTLVHDRSGNGNDGDLLPAADPPVWKDVKKWKLRTEAGL